MEKSIVCLILVGYAVLTDLQAAALRSSAASIRDFQVLPLMIWGAVISTVAVVYVAASFRSELRTGMKKRRRSGRKK